MNNEPPPWARELKSHLERIEAKIDAFTRPRRPAPETLSSTQVMEMLGYKCRKSFWVAVRAARVPYTRVTARRIIFNSDAVEAWMQMKTRNAG